MKLNITTFLFTIIVLFACVQARYFSFQYNWKGKYFNIYTFSPKTGNYTDYSVLNISEYPTNVDTVAGFHAVDNKRQLIYGAAQYTNDPDKIFSIVFRFDVKSRKTQRGKTIFGYLIEHMVYDEQSDRLFGLITTALKSTFALPILMEYDVDTLNQKQPIGNFSHYGFFLGRDTLYLAQNRTFSYQTMNSSPPKLVTLDLAKIPEVVHKINEVDIVQSVVPMKIGYANLFTDPALYSSNNPLILATMSNPGRLLQIRFDNEDIVKQVQTEPAGFSTRERYEVVNSDEHEFIQILRNSTSNKRYVVCVDTMTLNIKYTVDLPMAPDFPLVYVSENN
jgi:hypothetical protein